MTNDEVQSKLLSIGYQAYQENGGINFRAWVAEEGIAELDAWNNFDVLSEKGIMESIAAGSVQLTTAGVLFMEDNGFAPVEQTKHNRQCRFLILDALAKVREEHGVRAWPSYTEVIEISGVATLDFDRNEKVLAGLGLIDWPATQLMTITGIGMEQIVAWRSELQHLQRYHAFQDREDLSPQDRGHELELLLRDVLVNEGWEVEMNVHAPGEEHDLILHRNLEYYLVECKWVKAPTQPYLISVLRDRVTARMGMRGLFVSMSGYTPEAIKDTIDRLENAMVLLFGEKDVEEIVTHRITFSDLLQSKFHAAITKRSMLVDGKHYAR